MLNDGANENRLTLDGRKKLTITSVDEVLGFSDKELKLSVSGSRLTVLGNDIKISAFNKEGGFFTAEGEFCEIKFGELKSSFLKRFFK